MALLSYLLIIDESPYFKQLLFMKEYLSGLDFSSNQIQIDHHNFTPQHNISNTFLSKVIKK